MKTSLTIQFTSYVYFCPGPYRMCVTFVTRLNLLNVRIKVLNNISM